MTKYRSIPKPFMDRIKQELESIPHVKNKVILTIELHSDTAGILGKMSVKQFWEDQVSL